MPMWSEEQLSTHPSLQTPCGCRAPPAAAASAQPWTVQVSDAETPVWGIPTQ